METTERADAAEGTRTVQLRFAARADHLVLARLVLTGIAVAEGLSEQFVSDMKLAVTEACTNVVEHAYARRGGVEAMDGTVPSVFVSYTVGPAELAVEVADQGDGFDLAEVRRAITPPPKDATGGMGLSIIESLVDELTITSDRTGSRIVFVKRRDEAPPS